MFFKLGTRNVHHKGNKMTPIEMPIILLAPVFLCQKPNIPIHNLLKWDRGSFSEHTLCPYCPLLSRWFRMDDLWLIRHKLGISVLFNMRLAAKLLSWQWHKGCPFAYFVMYISGAKFDTTWKSTPGIYPTWNSPP